MAGYIRAYLRASTQDQDASRARERLLSFVAEKGKEVVSWYVENASGTSTQRSELSRLLSDSHAGDILLLEQVDRLTRLKADEWQQLKTALQEKGLLIVSLDLPTSHSFLTASNSDPFTERMLSAVNGMLLDMLAAIARKDYEDRQRRQAEGIAKAKTRGVYKGRPADQALHRKVVELKGKGFSVRKTAELAGCAASTVQRILKVEAQGE